MSAAAQGTSKAAHGDVASKKKKGPGALATAYLVIYNVVMTAGYVARFFMLTLDVHGSASALNQKQLRLKQIFYRFCFLW